MSGFWEGRTAGRKTASHFCWPMLLTIALVLTGCGVKNDLLKPNGQQTPKNAPDPSKPPNPIGR